MRPSCAVSTVLAISTNLRAAASGSVRAEFDELHGLPLASIALRLGEGFSLF
jgi:hypothetical protein